MKVKSILITGAANGIGKATAQLFHSKGYSVWLIDINEDALTALYKTLPNSEMTVCNLADKNSLEALAEQIRTKVSIDVAFLNVGVIIPGEFLNIPYEKSEFQLNINLSSNIYLNYICALKMRQQGSGHIINTVSMAGIIGLKGSAIYSASKFGLRGFLMAFNSEMKPYGITVSGIYLSAIDTPMLRSEAIHPNGSALNFVSPPVKVEKVAELVFEVLKTRRIESYLPFGDGLFSRILSAFPRLIPTVYSFMEKQGEKGRRKFIEENNLQT